MNAMQHEKPNFPLLYGVFFVFSQGIIISQLWRFSREVKDLRS